MKNASACSSATTTEERIGACLKLFGDAVVPESPGRWQIKNANDNQTTITVEVDQIGDRRGREVDSMQTHGSNLRTAEEMAARQMRTQF